MLSLLQSFSLSLSVRLLQEDLQEVRQLSPEILNSLICVQLLHGHGVLSKPTDLILFSVLICL